MGEAMSDIALEHVVALALRLSVREQAQLLERIAANLAHEMTLPAEAGEETWSQEELAALLGPAQPRSGAEIAAMIASGGLGDNPWSEMINPHITDPVEWLKVLRQEMYKASNAKWDEK